MAAEHRRVFFALLPDVACAARLEEAAQAVHGLCGGRPVRREKLHLTLAFIGAATPAQIEDLCAAAALVRGEAFELRIDRYGSFRRSQIVWAGCSEVPVQLSALAAALPGAAAAFAAHVSLLRKAPGSAAAWPALAAIRWPVGEFVLAESRLGEAATPYRIIARWPLASGRPGAG